MFNLQFMAKIIIILSFFFTFSTFAGVEMESENHKKHHRGKHHHHNKHKGEKKSENQQI